MSDPSRRLFEPLIHREVAEIAPAVHDHIDRHGLDETASALLRFSVLAHANSLHARNAWLSALAVRELVGAKRAAVEHLVSAAVYLAESRVPWGRAPAIDIPDPKPLSTEMAVAVIRSGDRERARGWLAAVCNEGDFEAIRAVANQLPGSEGWGAISAAAGIRTLRWFPPAAYFGGLSLPLSEWLLDAGPNDPVDSDALARYREKPDAERFHQLQLVAAFSALRRGEDSPEVVGSFEPYRLAEDFGARAQLCTIGADLGLDEEEVGLLQQRAAENATHGETWEEWSFA